MRQALALLVCALFTQAQSLALSGGPRYPSNSQSVQGTYSGTLLPEDLVATGIDPLFETIRLNSIGLFTYGIPQVGLGSGRFILFAEGQISFLGTIDVLGDPDGGKFLAILDTTFGITTGVTDGEDGDSVTTGVLTGHASGRMNASLKDSNDPFSLPRIEGDAFLAFDAGLDPISAEIILQNIISFVVDGYKQSEFSSVSGVDAGGGASS